MMERSRLVAISGNLQRPSRSWHLAETIAQAVAERIPVTVEHYDIEDAGPGLGTALRRDQLPAEALRVVQAIEQCDLLVVTTPVYKGSYTGLLKHLIDFVEMDALVERPVILGATGGRSRHALMVEHVLRPLFGFFQAATISTGIYADDSAFTDYVITDMGVRSRIDQAAQQAALLVAAGALGELDEAVVQSATARRGGR